MARRKLVAPAKSDAAAVHLIYVCDDQPGLRRQRRGKGFIYLDTRGRRVVRNEVLARIRALAIPPAYRDVWICPHPRGHLQATGRDDKGRKQYRYHSHWRRIRDGRKFEHVRDFGAALPRIRRRVREDLALSGWPRDKVLALIVRLLDTTRARIGNEYYANANGSYGLTTLRSYHVHREGSGLRLSFKSKSGRRSEIELGDRRLVGLLSRIQQLPGQRLFQYLDEDGKRQAVDSGMVNDYLRRVGGGDFTAKDFRTWAGTVHAIGLLACTPLPPAAPKTARRQAANEVIKQVASALRNTPSVCRASYIHPKAFAGWEDGSLHRAVPPETSAYPRRLEAAVLRYLKKS